MVEIRPTRQSGLLKQTRPGQVFEAHQARGYAIFITICYIQIKLFLIKLIVSMDYTVDIVPHFDWGGENMFSSIELFFVH